MNRPYDPVIAGAAGAATFLALFAFCCWAGSRLLDHLEDRVYREQEKQK